LLPLKIAVLGWTKPCDISSRAFFEPSRPKQTIQAIGDLPVSCLRQKFT
jgi:hypothetical protein